MDKACRDYKTIKQNRKRGEKKLMNLLDAFLRTVHLKECALEHSRKCIFGPDGKLKKSKRYLTPKDEQIIGESLEYEPSLEDVQEIESSSGGVQETESCCGEIPDYETNFTEETQNENFLQDITYSIPSTSTNGSKSIHTEGLPADHMSSFANCVPLQRTCDAKHPNTGNISMRSNSLLINKQSFQQEKSEASFKAVLPEAQDMIKRDIQCNCSYYRKQPVSFHRIPSKLSTGSANLWQIKEESTDEEEKLHSQESNNSSTYNTRTPFEHHQEETPNGNSPHNNQPQRFTSGSVPYGKCACSARKEEIISVENENEITHTNETFKNASRSDISRRSNPSYLRESQSRKTTEDIPIQRKESAHDVERSRYELITGQPHQENVTLHSAHCSILKQGPYSQRNSQGKPVRKNNHIRFDERDVIAICRNPDERNYYHTPPALQNRHTQDIGHLSSTSMNKEGESFEIHHSNISSHQNSNYSNLKRIQRSNTEESVAEPLKEGFKYSTTDRRMTNTLENHKPERNSDTRAAHYSNRDYIHNPSQQNLSKLTMMKK